MIKELNGAASILAEIHHSRQEEKKMNNWKTLETDRKKKEKKKLMTLENKSQAIKDMIIAVELLKRLIKIIEARQHGTRMIVR